MERLRYHARDPNTQFQGKFPTVSCPNSGLPNAPTMDSKADDDATVNLTARSADDSNPRSSTRDLNLEKCAGELVRAQTLRVDAHTVDGRLMHAQQ